MTESVVKKVSRSIKSIAPFLWIWFDKLTVGLDLLLFNSFLFHTKRLRTNGGKNGQKVPDLAEYQKAKNPKELSDV